MKKLFMILVNLTCFIGYSQEINWQDLNKINIESKLLEPVKNNNFAVFKIKNINKFLYKVEITGQGFDLITPIPTELQKLFRLSPEEVKAIGDNSKATNAVEDIKKVADAMDKLSKEVSENDKPLSEKLQEISTKCKTYSAKADNLKKQLFNLKILKINLINIAQQDISFKEMSAKTEVSDEVPNPKNIYDEVLKYYVEVEKLYYTSFENANKDNIQNEKVKNKIKEAKDKIEKSYEVLIEENILTLYEQLHFLNSELKNEKNFIAQASPIQMTGDFIEYKCKITPSTTNNLGAYKDLTEIKLVIPNKGGLKVDFSVGPTLSLGNNALDEKYFLEPSLNIGKSILRKRENNNSGTPGLAAMMHFYPRTGSEKSFGGLFGIGAGFQTVKDVDLSFYLGGSAILGKVQKVMLNTGISLLRVDRLKDKEYIIDKEYDTKDLIIENVVEKVFKPSFFISLSYNFAKRVNN